MQADFEDFKSISYHNVIVVNKIISFTKFHLLFLNLVPQDSRVKLKGFHSQPGMWMVLPTGHGVEGPVKSGMGNIKFTVSVVERKALSWKHT